MRKLFALIATGLVALLLAGCDGNGESGSSGGSSGDTEPSGPVAGGTPIEVDEGRWDSTVTVHSAEWHTAGQGDNASTPSSGAYLAIDVEWSGEGSYNPLYLNFRSDTGTEATGISGAMAGVEPALSSGDLGGGTVRGFVTYDVAQGPGAVILTDPRGETLGSWTIPA